MTWECGVCTGSPVAVRSCGAVRSLRAAIRNWKRAEMAMRTHATVKVPQPVNSHVIPPHHFAKDYLQSKIQVAVWVQNF